MPKKATVFVLLPAGTDSEERFHQAIRPACEAVQADCRRAMDSPYDGRLLQGVYREIEKADAIVADLTGNNPNVFYELGVAYGLKRPTLLVAERLQDVPFDVRDSKIIEYLGDIGMLRVNLTTALSRLLADREQLAVYDSTAAVPPRTLTIVVGDIVGFSALSAQIGELDGSEALAEYLRRIHSCGQEHKIADFSVVGDSFLATFEQTDDALAFAIEIRNPHLGSGFEPLGLRVAIHRSSIAIRLTRHGTTLLGAGVTVAVRLASVAMPNQILLSAAAAADLSPGQLAVPPNMTTVRLEHGKTLEAIVLDQAG